MASGSTKVVIAALAANGLIAVAKFAAAAWTGSAAMLSEAIHSLADSANQGLLLLGMKRAQRPPDARHPFGYGKEVYFWAFVVAILLFSLGAGVAIYEGISKLRHPHPATDPWINYLVLIVALVFELGSTAIAVREFNARRGAQGIIAALRSSKDPALFTVLLENVAAMAGLLIALTGIAAAHLLGWTQADAVASIAIGLVLGLVAAFMCIETKGLLIGEAAAPALSTAITTIIQTEMTGASVVSSINEIRTMHLGPDDVLVTVGLDFRDTATARDVETTIARLERSIKAIHPEVRHLYLEAEGKHAGAAKPGEIPGQIAAGPTAPTSPAENVLIAPIAPRPASAPVPAKNYLPAKNSKRKKRR